jgi:TIR domain
MDDDSTGGYRYDVFLSYSRSGQWETFVDEVFEPILVHWLGEELGRTPAIFKDRAALSIGQNWLEALELALRSSRVMITLWSRQYFSSEWCRRELSFMLARANEFKIRGAFDRIVMPATIHDGRNFPAFLSALQAVNLAEYADPFMTNHSVLREKLSAKIQELSRATASAIEMVPTNSFEWNVRYSNYLTLFSQFEGRQSLVPSLGGIG